jgi:hypothetical protein
MIPDHSRWRRVGPSLFALGLGWLLVASVLAQEATTAA